MREILLILDGADDDIPCPELGGTTPLLAAYTPHLDRLRRNGTIGSFRTFTDGRIPGSENAIPALLGYPEGVYGSLARGPLEALGLDMDIGRNDYAMRVNIVEVDADAKIITDRPTDISPIHIQKAFFKPLEESGFVVRAISTTKAVAVTNNRLQGADFKSHLTIPSIVSMVDEYGSTRRLSIQTWGEGQLPCLPSFVELSGHSHPVAITGTPLVRGIAKTIGMKTPDVKGATGDYTTDYEAKARAALEALDCGADFVLIHVEAPDEAGHIGDPLLKKQIIEDIDRRLLANLIPEIRRYALPVKLTVTADHPTPCALRRHSAAPVSRLSCVLNPL